MKITFIGTGEACDPQRRNTSVLVVDNDHAVLLDCGFTSAQPLFTSEFVQKIQAVWISHLHGDHFFGLPHLLVYYHGTGRTSPLHIISGDPIERTIQTVVDAAYNDLYGKLSFSVKYHHIGPDQVLQKCGFQWQTATTNHIRSSFALRLSNKKKSLYYSGDGRPTPDCGKLITLSDLVIHEAYSLIQSLPKHSSIEECLELCSSYNPKNLALVHMNENTRCRINKNLIIQKLPAGTQLFLPKDGEILTL